MVDGLIERAKYYFMILITVKKKEVGIGLFI